MFFQLRLAGIPLQDALILGMDGRNHLSFGRRRFLGNDQLERFRRSSWSPLVFRIRKIVRFDFAILHAGFAKLLPGDPIGIGEHHEKMPAIQRGRVVISHPGMIRKNHWDGYAIK